MRLVPVRLGLLFAAAAVLQLPSPAAAQAWPHWADGAFGPGYRGSYRWAPPQPPPSRGGYRDDWDEDDAWDEPPGWRERQRPAPRSGPGARGPDLLEGGPRPSIAAVAPPVVPFRSSYEANSIVIDTAGRKLYFVLPEGRAYVYDISVGREGFSWTGTETVSRKQAWPDWHPPAEMRERDPKLPVKMTGGVRNPLGAMALYLGTTLYRIHGTNDERSIGRASSSGCFRMMNANVLHLASITPIGTKVTVVSGLPPAVVASTRVERRPAAFGYSEGRGWDERPERWQRTRPMFP